MKITEEQLEQKQNLTEIELKLKLENDRQSLEIYRLKKIIKTMADQIIN